MLFNSLSFLLFFAVVYALFWLLRGGSARNLLLLLASYLFYAAWSPVYVLLLLLSTVVDWGLARAIAASEAAARRRALLLVSLACNLGLLGYFKYGGFLLANAVGLLQLLGIRYAAPAQDVVLPIGISFYTFASLSYTIDVYRRDIDARWRFRDYALFVSFFPHLVAGPIVRARQLLPQISSPRSPQAAQVGWGFALLCMGLFCKTVLADQLFAPVVDEVYAGPARFGPGDAWSAVLAFSGQIYCDFAGYSLCAIGLASCFGYSFPDNFRFPYGARGFSDFWQRWHRSLSTWLRDYLYIPLGGNRGGAAATLRNLMLTMLIGGLWHGASWMFVLWGGLHGLYLVAEHALVRGRLREPVSPQILRTLLTFLLVTLAWIPFRAQSVAQAAQMVATLFSADNPDRLDLSELGVCWLALLGVLGVNLALRDTTLNAAFMRLGPALQIAILAACMTGIFLCSGAGAQRAFIYFQF